MNITNTKLKEIWVKEENRWMSQAEYSYYLQYKKEIQNEKINNAVKRAIQCDYGDKLSETEKKINEVIGKRKNCNHFFGTNLNCNFCGCNKIYL